METVVVGVGDCQVSNRPEVELVTHALGSCIAVAVYDPVVMVGGLLHFLLPESEVNPERSYSEPFLFADTGIPELFRRLYALGADRRRLSVRLVGGAQVLDPNGLFQIGRRNYYACRKILWNAGLPVDAEAVGGSISRTVRFEIGSGNLYWNSGGGAQYALPFRGMGGAA